MLLPAQAPCWCYAFFKRGDRWVTEKGFCESIGHGHGFVRVSADVPGWPFPRLVEVHQQFLNAARAPHFEAERAREDDNGRDDSDVPLLRIGDEDAQRQGRARKRVRLEKSLPGRGQLLPP